MPKPIATTISTIERIGRRLAPFMALGALACGGDDGDEPPPPPAGTSFVFSLSASDLCNADVPRPTDLFRGDDLVSELAACPGATDPIEAALEAVTRDDGAPLGAEITLGVGNGDLDAASVAAVTDFSLTSTVGTSTGAAIPGVLLVRATEPSTVGADWSVVAATPLYAGGKLTVTPDAPLEHGFFYALIATDAILAGGGAPVGASPAMALITGVEAIAAGAYEGLDGPTAAKLERERQRLSPVVDMLGRANPPIARERIKSIQGWHSALGPKRLSNMIDSYRTAVQQGRFSYSISRTGGNKSPDMVYRQGTPASFYDRVDHFFEGTISVPNILDDSGHLRPGWATTDVSTTEVPFLISIPKGVMRYGVSLLLPGYGRGNIDARALAQTLGGGATSAVLAIDLPFHGARTVDPATGAPKLVDAASNGDPEFQGPDGIPDASGQGFFSGDPRAARDRIAAAVIEVVHILETLKDGDAFRTNMINPDGRELSIIAQGQTAQIGVHAAAAVRVDTVMLPSGGVGLPALVGDGPDGLKAGFMATVPSAVNDGNLATYLTRLEETVLTGVSLAASAESVKEQYIKTRGLPVRVLLPHGSAGQAGQHVPEAARTALVQLLELPTGALPTGRVSQHKQRCDDFYVHTCRLGEPFGRVLAARQQLGSFISSGGRSPTAPAN